MVTTVSIRLALMKLILASSGVESGLVSVLIANTGQPRSYIALIPVERRTALYQYLNDHLGFAIPLGNGPLSLTAEQAAATLALAMDLRTIAAA